MTNYSSIYPYSSYYNSNSTTTNSSSSSSSFDYSSDWTLSLWSNIFNQSSSSTNQSSNINITNEIDSNLHPASDVDINGVITSAILNFFIFSFLMLSYEVLRRCFPNVYASKQSREARMEQAANNIAQRSLDLEEDEGRGEEQGVMIDKRRKKGNGSEQEEEGHDNIVSTSLASSSDSHEQWEDNVPHDLNTSKKATNNLKHRTNNKLPTKNDSLIQQKNNQIYPSTSHTHQYYHHQQQHIKMTKNKTLPDVYKSGIPLQWLKPVYNISWRTVRENSGLDAYFFLRYIRMCLKITYVSAIWGMITLFPVYAFGENGASGWYHVSMANVSQGSPIIWVSVFFIYFFSFFVLFVIKQEYKHFVQLRLDFLGKGDYGSRLRGDLQHHYSLMIENIPRELRSDKALFAYFDKLFPGKVHSANIILNLPELEALSQRKLRILRRLEKSIAYYEATGTRPTHITGRFRTMICGIESSPVEWCCDPSQVANMDDIVFDHNDYRDHDDLLHNISHSITRRGVRVDSIEYYTRDLQNMNVKLFQLQKKKSQIAAFGNRSLNALGWFSVLSEYADLFFNDDELSDDNDDDSSKVDNGEGDDHDDSSIDSGVSTWKKPASRRYLFQEFVDQPIPNVNVPSASLVEENLDPITTEDTRTMINVKYGSLEDSSFDEDLKISSHSPSNDVGKGSKERLRKWFHDNKKKQVSFKADELDSSFDSSKEEPLIVKKPAPIITKAKTTDLKPNYIKQQKTDQESKVTLSPRSKITRRLSKAAARIGFDFGVYFLKLVGRRLDKAVHDPEADVMSSTGFITFLDLGTVTSVASTPLTHKPRTLTVEVAPEPRDIIWDNCSCRSELNERRTYYANISLVLGAILWSIPLATIQALASAEQVAKLPGMEWISDFDEGRLKVFLNAYLPVIALLSLIMILPLIFEAIAINYEKRKTMSDVNKSVVSRYFYYQLANIYISVTAGSIWLSGAQIIEHPSAGLEILGNSLPTVVGYFIALLVTKILGGLPIVILRVGALSRFLLLRLLHRTKFLTQRELDNVYIVEPLYYGWEYPTQMLVIVICFTYACISPIILVFGAIFFFAALMVYKKQVLYVYSRSYESGGDLFPLVCDRTIFGLICGQLTFMGYSIVRGGHFLQVLSILPLILFTLWIMKYFQIHFAEPSKRLTLELSRELDSKIEQKAQSRSLPIHRSSKNSPLFKPGTKTPRHQATTTSFSAIKNSIPQDLFDVNYYKQPVMTEPCGEPMFYRFGRNDSLTKATIEKIRKNRLHMWNKNVKEQEEQNVYKVV